MHKLSVHSPEEMFALWKKLSKQAKIILLKWELWAGKTTLIKWFAAGLWLDPDFVNSPTYTYVQDYDDTLLHIDMYNIQWFDQFVEKWIAELIHDYQYIAIERPAFIEEMWLTDTTSISIVKTGDQTRDVVIQ